MKYNPDIHHRRCIRLKDYDYSQTGAYYITVCTKDKQCLFGHIRDGKMILNEYGEMVEITWCDLTNHNKHIILDAFVIMPNHIHGIVIISNANNVGAGSKPAHFINPDQINRAGLEPAPTKPIPTFVLSAKRQPLYEIVRQFKTFSARRINESRQTTGVPIWQRNYYEHIIRSETELHKIREYIINNPLNWKSDENYMA